MVDCLPFSKIGHGTIGTRDSFVGCLKLIVSFFQWLQGCCMLGTMEYSPGQARML